MNPRQIAPQTNDLRLFDQLLGMHSANMPVQLGRNDALEGAVAALERFLAGVRHVVASEDRGMPRRSGAKGAHIQLGGSVVAGGFVELGPGNGVRELGGSGVGLMQGFGEEYVCR